MKTFFASVIFLSFLTTPILSQQNINKNSDGVISDLLNLSAMAQQFYIKPISMGGGGNSFLKWSIPEILDTTDNGNYTIILSDINQVLLKGVGYKEYWALITPKAIKIAQIIHE